MATAAPPSGSDMNSVLVELARALAVVRLTRAAAGSFVPAPDGTDHIALNSSYGERVGLAAEIGSLFGGEVTQSGDVSGLMAVGRSQGQAVPGGRGYDHLAHF